MQKKLQNSWGKVLGKKGSLISFHPILIIIKIECSVINNYIHYTVLQTYRLQVFKAHSRFSNKETFLPDNFIKMPPKNLGQITNLISNG